MKTSTIAIAGLSATAFIAYCIYFDKKRRSHPDFKKKLLEKRKSEKHAAANKGKVVFPDLRNVAEVQQFFLQQVQLGEELLAAGQIDEGIDHLTNAVAVCGQPQQLLGVLQASLPPEVFAKLTENLSTIGERLATSPSMKGLQKPASSPKITELSEQSEKQAPAVSAAPSSPASSNNIVDVDELEWKWI